MNVLLGAAEFAFRWAVLLGAGAGQVAVYALVLGAPTLALAWGLTKLQDRLRGDL